MPQYTIGLDFGTESVRAVVADVRDGTIAGQADHPYASGVIDDHLRTPAGTLSLPVDYALQSPRDWLAAASQTCREALRAGGIAAEWVVGVGVAFTSCTMLPCRHDGTPLCELPEFAAEPLARARLWKHHGAKDETDRLNHVARERDEQWLRRYGGAIGLEWLFPKMLEAFRAAPAVFHAADLWLEAGDWLVWQLVSGPFGECDANVLSRSACQAGYKALWNAETGYPSTAFLSAVEPGFERVLKKLAGDIRAPGDKAGSLSKRLAAQLGLNEGTPVAVATIDAHAGVPGAGVADNRTMVLVLGTSSCHMLMSGREVFVPGVAGVVKDGILPGSFGYETGQASVGDAFAWVADTLRMSHKELNRAASVLPPGSNGVLALDWLNGCRTPLMDGRLSGGFFGLTLNTAPAQLYRAMLEATAFGLRWIVDTLRDGGVEVNRFVASGGLPAKSPLLMQIYADVLGEPILLAESDQSVALGAAILGALAAGPAVTGHADAASAVRAMARQRSDLVYRPDAEAHHAYTKLYRIYRNLAAPGGVVAHAMRELRA